APGGARRRPRRLPGARRRRLGAAARSLSCSVGPRRLRQAVRRRPGRPLGGPPPVAGRCRSVLVVFRRPEPPPAGGSRLPELPTPAACHVPAAPASRGAPLSAGLSAWCPPSAGRCRSLPVVSGGLAPPAGGGLSAGRLPGGLPSSVGRCRPVLVVLRRPVSPPVGGSLSAGASARLPQPSVWRGRRVPAGPALPPAGS